MSDDEAERAGAANSFRMLAVERLRERRVAGGACGARGGPYSPGVDVSTFQH